MSRFFYKVLHTIQLVFVIHIIIIKQAVGEMFGFASFKRAFNWQHYKSFEYLNQKNVNKGSL